MYGRAMAITTNCALYSTTHQSSQAPYLKKLHPIKGRWSATSLLHYKKNGETSSGRRLVSISLVFLHWLSLPHLFSACSIARPITSELMFWYPTNGDESHHPLVFVDTEIDSGDGRTLNQKLQARGPAPTYAVAGSILDKYVKRKKLDPLEAYVPAVILTQLQIEDLGKTLEVDQPQYTSCRNLLRSGPAASLRVNIRAVAQYASDSGNGKTAFQSVDQCIRALEELDSLLLNASRNDPGASVKSMKAQIGVAVGALDSLLKTVPSDVLDKGKAIADAYRVPEEDTTPGNLDPELKQLESIL
ncbi:hypothetical protein RHSIM_Rhsim10G0107900 [Rhododendron simsii]|uniref:DUF7880 domain-containing protein n=1 Tax=Rhododendron simsii TaxID=118357 RepID=A0A834GB20_RHOSS|nr:hypothetical protein RHSIM_Rhsim10G0107900 [Rhododendron simsii]